MVDVGIFHTCLVYLAVQGRTATASVRPSFFQFAGERSSRHSETAVSTQPNTKHSILKDTHLFQPWGYGSQCDKLSRRQEVPFSEALKPNTTNYPSRAEHALNNHPKQMSPSKLAPLLIFYHYPVYGGLIYTVAAYFVLTRVYNHTPGVHQ